MKCLLSPLFLLAREARGRVFQLHKLSRPVGVLGRCAQTWGTAVGTADTEHGKVPTKPELHLHSTSPAALPWPCLTLGMGFEGFLSSSSSSVRGQGRAALTGCGEEGVDQLVAVLARGVSQAGGHGGSVLQRQLLGSFSFLVGFVLPLGFQHALEVQARRHICRGMTERGIQIKCAAKGCGSITLSQGPQ